MTIVPVSDSVSNNNLTIMIVKQYIAELMEILSKYASTFLYACINLSIVRYPGHLAWIVRIRKA